nr:DNA cytosine methyltransferase [Veillonella sp. oral taxon 780]
MRQEGKNPRKITPREASRLQGFPEEFIIPVSDTQAYKQFGNSVAVPVINAIALKMLEVLDANKFSV